MTKPTREHLAGLYMALELYTRECQPHPYTEALADLIAQAQAAPQAEPVAFDYPQFHEVAMGCGLEDRGIADRYEAMRYGYDEAADQFAAIIESLGPLYTHPAPDAELVALLRDERTYSGMAMLCQQGVVPRCRCHQCRMQRIDAKLASLR